MKAVKKIDVLVALLIMIIMTVLFATDFINHIQHNVLEYDEGWNATVAGNVFRYGQYRTSYADNIVFNNLITTGELVLLPTALLYQLFGITNVTSSIVSCFYGVLAFWAVFVLMLLCLKKKDRSIWTVCALASSLLVLSDGRYYYLSTRLIGEMACIFLLEVCFIFLFLYFTKRKASYMAITGAMAIAAFLTKSSMIFFSVTIFGMVLIETFLTKRVDIKGFCAYCIGSLIGIVVLEPYKLVQLGGIQPYLDWWKNEWANMMNQSSGVDVTYNIFYKVYFLREVFIGCSTYPIVLMVAVPVMLYALFIILKMMKKKCDDYGLLTMTMSGVAGASLIVYFVFLGGTGLVVGRRHAVNAYFVRIAALFLLLSLIFWCIENKSRKNRMYVMALIAAVLIPTVIPVNQVFSNMSAYVLKENDDSSSKQRMEDLLQRIEMLPDSSKLYVSGWWQEPNITLFLDRKMYNIDGVRSSSEFNDENAYFVVGNRIEGITKSELEKRLNCKLERINMTLLESEQLLIEDENEEFCDCSLYKIIADGE